MKDKTANKSRNEVSANKITQLSSANTKSQLSSVKFVLRPTKIYTTFVITNIPVVFVMIATNI